MGTCMHACIHTYIHTYIQYPVAAFDDVADEEFEIVNKFGGKLFSTKSICTPFNVVVSCM